MKKSIAEWLFDPVHLTIDFHRKLGRWPNVLRPKTFNEKILRQKLGKRNSRLSMLVDKIAVKQIVADRLGEDWITPTLWTGAALPPRNQRNWTMPYVIKANHGAGFNHFVHTEADQDWPLIERKCADWLSKRYGYREREWPYYGVTPTLLVEPFVGTAGAPNDYKFFIFNGRVTYIQVDTDRFADHKRAIFNRKWEKQAFHIRYIHENDDDPEPPPKSLEQMIFGAETLAAEAVAADMRFSRIDLYEVDGAPRFGEFSIFPAAGYGRFFPDKYDRIFGELWV